MNGISQQQIAALDRHMRNLGFQGSHDPATGHPWGDAGSRQQINPPPWVGRNPYLDRPSTPPSQLVRVDPAPAPAKGKPGRPKRDWVEIIATAVITLSMSAAGSILIQLAGCSL